MNDDFSPKEYPSTENSSRRYILLQSRPVPAIVYELTDYAVTLYAERAHMVETYEPFMLSTVEQSNPELTHALEASMGQDIIVNRYENPKTKNLRNILFDALMNGRVAVFNDSTQCIVPFVTVKSSDVWEDYRTVWGEVQVCLPDGSVIYSYTYGS